MRILAGLLLCLQLQGCFFFVFPLPRVQPEPEKIERPAAETKRS